MFFEMEQEQWGETGLFCPTEAAVIGASPMNPVRYPTDAVITTSGSVSARIRSWSALPCTKVGYRHLRGNDQPEKRQQHEVSPRFGHYPKIHLVHAALHPSSL